MSVRMAVGWMWSERRAGGRGGEGARERVSWARARNPGWPWSRRTRPPRPRNTNAARKEKKRTPRSARHSSMCRRTLEQPYIVPISNSGHVCCNVVPGKKPQLGSSVIVLPDSKLNPTNGTLRRLFPFLSPATSRPVLLFLKLLYKRQPSTSNPAKKSFQGGCRHTFFDFMSMYIRPTKHSATTIRAGLFTGNLTV